MSTKKKETVNKVNKTNSNITKTPTDDQTGKHEPEQKKELPKEYFVGIVRGVKYVYDNGKGRRDVCTKWVWADHDLANEPAVRDEKMEAATQELIDEGYFLFEDDALADATLSAGKALSRLSHEMEYGDAPCHICTREIVQAVEDLLTTARNGYIRHHDLMEELKPTEGVGVFPNADEMDKYTVTKFGKFTLKDPPTVRTVKPRCKFGVIRPDEIPEELREGLTKFILSREAKEEK